MPRPIRIQDALGQAAQILEQNGVPAPRLTAEVLLAHALGRERAFLYAHPECLLTPAQQQSWRLSLEERCSGKPAQYITGIQEFYGLEFRVTPDVLIPRPETEILVEEALARLRGGEQVVDIGTGSGCIAISVKKNRPEVFMAASDRSLKALRIARENAQRLGTPVSFVQTHLAEALAPGSVAMALCNPPYVPRPDLASLQRELRYEPLEALVGGEDGLDVYRELIPSALRVLVPGGWLIVELGAGLRAAVERMLNRQAWEEPEVRADLSGIDRVLIARKR